MAQTVQFPFAWCHSLKPGNYPSKAVLKCISILEQSFFASLLGQYRILSTFHVIHIFKTLSVLLRFWPTRVGFHIKVVVYFWLLTELMNSMFSAPATAIIMLCINFKISVAYKNMHKPFTYGSMGISFIMPDGSTSASCISHSGASRYLGHARFRADDRAHEVKSNQVEAQLPLGSHLLTLHWPK